MTAMGWKLYMLNGAWNVVVLAVIWVTWVETKGKTLEEVDEALGGKPLSSAHHGSAADKCLGQVAYRSAIASSIALIILIRASLSSYVLHMSMYLPIRSLPARGSYDVCEVSVRNSR
jgi:hypothetical protein